MMARASVPDPELYAFHGLRVGSYNAGKQTEDPTLIVEVGDWASGAHVRYGRRRRNKVLQFAQDMINVASSERSRVFGHSSEIVNVAGAAISKGGLPVLPVQQL